ncbi:MAG: TonB family protein [Acidobacteriota bacterium]
MNNSHFGFARLLALILTLVVGAGLTPSQEGFKGSAAVFTRAPKKAHSTKRPNAARIPAKAIEANERGNTHFDAARYLEAIAAYREAIDLSPRYADAYVNLGDAYKELKRYQEAIEAYKQALKLKPNYADAYNGLGDSYEAVGRKSEAEEAHSRANANFGSGGVLNGKAITLGRPSYPAIAKAARASGQVEVRVVIDETGQVIRAEAISGHPLLQAAAVKAASESVFSPTTLSGQPVKVTGTIIYNFTLQ